MDKQNFSLNSILLNCPLRSEGVGVRGWNSSRSGRPGPIRGQYWGHVTRLDQSEAAGDQAGFWLAQSQNTALLLASDQPASGQLSPARESSCEHFTSSCMNDSNYNNKVKMCNKPEAFSLLLSHLMTFRVFVSSCYPMFNAFEPGTSLTWRRIIPFRPMHFSDSPSTLESGSGVGIGV